MISLGQKFAALDLGSNTFILLIAQKTENGLDVLHEEIQIVRLGQGLNDSHEFHPDAIDRAIESLKRFRQIIEKHSCDLELAVGTAACRVAKNADQFLARVNGETSFEIQIIPGEEEAHLIHLATQQAFPKIEMPYVVFDIGGGSTEWILVDSENSEKLFSLPFGVVKLTEKFIQNDPPLETELQNMESFIREEFEKNIPHFRPQCFVATAGTPTALCAVSKNLKSYEPGLIHGEQLSNDVICKIYDRLCSMDNKSRVSWTNLPEKRADVIVAGTLLLKLAIEYSGLSGCLVSDHGLRYGILQKLISSA